MNIIQQIVNKKLNAITTNELLKYSTDYQIPITVEQAQQVVTLIKGQNINIYNPEERLELIKKIAKVTSPSTAQQVNTLLQKLLK
jgi:TRAP-type C4-dicarboxylate transport system substrate-binding protein